MNYEMNKKYFQETNLKNPIIAVLIGIFILIVFSGAGKWLGVIIVAIAGALIYSKISGRLTDSQIDEICSNEVLNAKKKAFNKLGIDEDQVKIIDPILIGGSSHKDIITSVKHKKGKDSRWRSSNYEAVLLFFSEQQVYCYTYRFSIIANEKNESTDEYFYKDIVSVSTSSDNVTFKDSSGIDTTINYEEFKLTTSGGTSIRCSMKDHGVVEKSIQGMKQLLREKKSI
jgi:hypothetical protein